jgi:hypothetical protein
MEAFTPAPDKVATIVREVKISWGSILIDIPLNPEFRSDLVLICEAST